jgi:hypothetical protein
MQPWQKSPQYWPSPSPHDMEHRDRLKDLEHQATDHTARLDSHEQQLTWHRAALGLVLWILLQGKALDYAPEAAGTIAAILKGLGK